jgi:hypothetical protein
VTVDDLAGVVSRPTYTGASAAGTITNQYGFWARSINNNTSGTPTLTVTNAYGLKVDNQGNAVIGTQNVTGVYIANQGGGALTNVGLQFQSASTVAAGIQWGTDVQLFRSAAGTLNVGTTTALTAAGSLSVTAATGSNTLTLDTGNSSGTVNLGGIAGTVNLGASGTTAVTLGSTTSSSTTTIQGGSGGILIGGGSSTAAINLGTGTGIQTINLGTGGTGAKTVAVGSTASTSTTTIQAGSGGISFNGNTTTTGTTTLQGSFETNSQLNTPFGGFGAHSNLLLNSEAFNNWSVSNATLPTADTIVAPDGQTTAEALTNTLGNGFVFQTTSTAIGATYTFSIWLRAPTTQTATIRIGASGTAAGPTSVSVNLTSTWQRYTVTQDTSGYTGFVRPIIFPGGTGGGIGTVYAWGAQLEAGSTAGVYTSTSLAVRSAVTYGTAVNGSLTVAGSNGTTSLIIADSGAQNSGVTIGGDTNLYRSAANTLKTDDALIVGGTSGSNSTGAFQVQNASGTSLLNVDSSNTVITLNTQNNGATTAWTTANNSGFTARANGATVTANGYVYYISGYTVTNGTPGTYSAAVQYAKLNADGTLGNWTTTTALGGARYAASAVYANGYIYVMGGSTSSGVSNVQTTVYFGKVNNDGSVTTWNTTSPLGTGTYFASAAAANGYIYYVGGSANGSGTIGLVQYAKIQADGSLAAWGTTTPLTTGPTNGERDSHGVVISGNTIYVIGGENGATAKQDILYNTINPLTGALGASWTDQGATNQLPTTNEAFSYAAADGYVYVMGGFAGGGTQTNKFWYAPIPAAGGQLGAWTDATATNPLPAARGDQGAVVYNGYIYTIAGTNSSSTSQSTIYTSSTGRIKIGGSLDLVGLTGANAADGTTNSGSLTAGNTNIIGALQVQGMASFAQSVAVGANLTVGVDFAVGGNTMLKTTSATALQIQNASSTTLLTADTSGMTITVSGTTTTFATFALSEAHFKSTQTTKPTIGTPSTCGTTPTAAVTNSSTDSAGSITITEGSGTAGLCSVVVSFNKAYGAAPKSIILTPKDANGSTARAYVSAAATGSFTVTFGATIAVSTAANYYYWVVE